MDNKTLAEMKFRPLKKQMQQTFRRIKQAVQREELPERSDVEEFVRQIEIMVSYPGFGDAAYPEIVAEGQDLAECSASHDHEGLRQALAHLFALQQRCHAGRTTTY